MGLTPKANFMQVMFLEGKVVFKYAGGRWKYCGIYATVSDVAGGRTLGKFGTVTKADKYGSLLFLKVNDPNGFWTWAQLCAKPVQMTADAMPWQLLKITTHGGTRYFPCSQISQFKVEVLLKGLFAHKVIRTGIDTVKQ